MINKYLTLQNTGSLYLIFSRTNAIDTINISLTNQHNYFSNYLFLKLE